MRLRGATRSSGRYQSIKKRARRLTDALIKYDCEDYARKTITQELLQLLGFNAPSKSHYLFAAGRSVTEQRAAQQEQRCRLRNRVRVAICRARRRHATEGDILQVVNVAICDLSDDVALDLNIYVSVIRLDAKPRQIPQIAGDRVEAISVRENSNHQIRVQIRGERDVAVLEEVEFQVDCGERVSAAKRYGNVVKTPLIGVDLSIAGRSLHAVALKFEALGSLKAHADCVVAREAALEQRVWAVVAIPDIDGVSERVRARRQDNRRARRRDNRHQDARCKARSYKRSINRTHHFTCDWLQLFLFARNMPVDEFLVFGEADAGECARRKIFRQHG